MKKMILAVLLLAVLTLCIVSCGSGTDTTADITTSEEDIMTTPNETTVAITEITTAAITTEEKIYPIEGKTFVFLGSSVTYGSASGGYSFADVLKDQYKCRVYKFAVSGTTLVDNGDQSYVQRMQKIYKNLKADHFIVQLSTNDASQSKPMGRITADDVKNLEAFDTTTILGAIEYIVCYAQETWGCPVSFYTGTKYDSAQYKRMVDMLYKIQEKWGIGIIDLWNDADMNAVSQQDYARYMSDPIHPNRTGYEEWWTPKFAEHLQKYE